MTTEKLKVCLIGATGVGKTSLVARYVHSIFSDSYRTTIGVAIERRDVRRGDRTIELVIWDLSGEDEFQNVQPAYLRGAAGYLLVADGARLETIATALTLQTRLRETVGDLPFAVAINKADLADTWALRPRDVRELELRTRATLYTSAKTGASVDELFGRLVDEIALARQERLWI
jgi:small GTP-binding protein